MIKLGQEVKDKISGFRGIATSRTVFLNGCVRIEIQPPITKEGNLPDQKWFDEDQIKVLKEKSILEEKKKPRTGGPQSSTPPKMW